MEPHEERVIEWSGDLIAAYVRIAKVLTSPGLLHAIELPLNNIGDAEFMRDATAVIVRSLDLIKEQPMDEIVFVTLRQLLLDWLTAFDLTAIELSQPKPWREQVFTYTMVRLVAGADFALELLTGQPPAEE